MALRTLALALAVVLLVTFVTPAKAEAIEPTAALLIAGAAIVVVVLIVYLIVANVEGDRKVEQPEGPRIVHRDGTVVWVAVALPRESP